jgi:hypothetical protein
MTINIILITVLTLIFCIIYDRFFIYDNFASQIKYIEHGENYDYAKQKFTHTHSHDRWHSTHSSMYDKLNKHSYITYDYVHKSNQKHTVFPKSLKDIVQIIKDNKGRKIRVSGGHHTFSSISMSDDIIMRTYYLKKILKLENNSVTVESGMLLHELNAYLRKHDLAIHVLPAIPWQTIAGALATSSHGSTTDRGSMSSMIEDIAMVLSDGSVKTYNKQNPEFKALLTNLGCLGVVYSVTLKCVPAFTIEHITKMLSLYEFKKVMNDKSIREKYTYIQGYIYPKIKGKNVKVYYRKIVNDFDKKKLPLSIKTDGSEKKSIKYKPYKDKGRVDWSDNILTNNQEAGYYTEGEYAVSVDDWIDAVDDIIKLYFDYEKKYNYKSGWPLLVRFTMRDDSLLSMTSGRDSVFIDTFNSRRKAKDVNLDNYFKSVEKMLIDKYKGRPHYGKRNYLNKKKMLKIYGNNVNKFNKIRKDMDKSGMFSNKFINKLLGH